MNPEPLTRLAGLYRNLDESFVHDYCLLWQALVFGDVQGAFFLLFEHYLILAKQRNGPTGTVTVAFQGQYSRFANMPS